jgi:hydroxymethylglutaryl-CoA lyase
MAEAVTIFEVSPRDGLQNETKLIASAGKIELVNLLSACGFKKIEVTSFVSKSAVPQMAGAAAVMAGITRYPGISYAALTPNLRGYTDAKLAGADEVAVFASASEGFSQKNINCSIDESFARFKPVLGAAKSDGLPVRGYVSCIIDCPYDGPVNPKSVTNVAQRLIDIGCYEVSLGDTIGTGTPKTVTAMITAVLDAIPAQKLAGHFHDTRGQAIDNISVCLDYGLRVFDASVGGLGGCPYAPGAPGNVDTVSVAEFLSRKGYTTGLNLARVADAAAFAKSLSAQA